MNLHHPSTAPEPVVQATEVHSSHAVLTKRRGAHDARFDGNVEVGRAEDRLRMRGHYFSQRDEFRVSGSLRKVKSISIVGQCVSLDEG